MKLYVWEDVLRDYTSGMVVALAPDLETALDCLEPYIRDSMGGAKPTVVDLTRKVKPRAWYVYGGG